MRKVSYTKTMTNPMSVSAKQTSAWLSKTLRDLFMKTIVRRIFRYLYGDLRLCISNLVLCNYIAVRPSVRLSALL